MLRAMKVGIDCGAGVAGVECAHARERSSEGCSITTGSESTGTGGVWVEALRAEIDFGEDAQPSPDATMVATNATIMRAVATPGWKIRLQIDMRAPPVITPDHILAYLITVYDAMLGR